MSERVLAAFNQACDQHEIAVAWDLLVRLDVRHFMAAMGITTVEELRTVDHRAVIAWERMQREQEGAASSTVHAETGP